MNTNPDVFTVPQLREQIRAAEDALGLTVFTPTSKLRKAELVNLMESLQIRLDERKVGEPQVYQGAMHEAGDYQCLACGDTVAIIDQPAHESTHVPHLEDEDEAPVIEFVKQVAKIDFVKVAEGLVRTAQAVKAAVAPVASGVQALTAKAWGDRTVQVQSMGRTVRGKVVDAITRQADVDGKGGRVCLVVQHEGRVTRTLHRYDQVQFV
jgi:hypothetical protein